jgi:hypothetical protein
MAITVGDAVVWLRANESKLGGDLAGGERLATAWVGRVARIVKAGLTGALVAGGAAIVGGVAAIGGIVVKSIGEARAAERTTAQLNTVIASTGGVAGVTAAAVQDLATALQRTTTYEDDATTAAAALLLTFTNIGKDVFPQALGMTLDMSTALGQDLKSSAVQLGKALQDPIEGVTALRRVGVNFTEAQQATIKSLVESNRLLDAQKLILAELNTEFGGSAAALGQTFDGQLAILGNRLGSLGKTLGGLLLEPLQALTRDFLSPLLDGIEVFAGAFLDAFAQVGRAFAQANLRGLVADLLRTLNDGQPVWLNWATLGREVAYQVGMIGVSFVEVGFKLRDLVAFAGSALAALKNWFVDTFGGLATYLSNLFHSVDLGLQAFNKTRTGDILGALATWREADAAMARATGGLNTALYGGAMDLTDINRAWETFNANLATTDDRLTGVKEDLATIRAGGAPTLQAWELDEGRIVQGATRVVAQVKPVVATVGQALGQGLEHALHKAGRLVGDFVGKARTALGNLLPDLPGLGDLMAPGANGPFENLFRAADVAKLGAASPWAAKLGLDQATAQRIVSDFKAELITEEVQALIDMPGLVDQVKLAQLAEQTTQAFITKVAAQAGVGTGTVGALLGVQQTAAGGTSVPGAAGAVGTLLGAVGRGFAEKKADVVAIGKAFIDYIIEGFDAQREALLAAWQALVDAMKTIASGLPTIPAPPTASAGGVTAPQYAAGTSFAPGGWAWVGEQGPELVRLPRGSQVTPALAVGGATFNITVHAPGGQPAAVARAAELGVRQALQGVGAL